MFDRFTMDSRKVMKAARKAAINNGYISTRHFLIGLSQVEGESKKALDRVGLTTDKLKAESKKYDEGNKLCVGVIPFTQNAKKAIEKAVEIAVAQKDNHISPSHLLIGLCRIKGTSAQKVVRALVTAEEVTKIIDDYEANLKQETETVVNGDFPRLRAEMIRDPVTGKLIQIKLVPDSVTTAEQEPEKYQSPFTGEWV